MNVPDDNMARTRIRLSEMGEFAIIKEIVVPLARHYNVDAGLGDDCGYIQVGGAMLAVSADVGPRPLVHQLLGYENDFIAAGWHAVVATASDIATAAARPLFLIDTIDAPSDLETGVLEDYLNGYFSACAEFGYVALGGDVRQGQSLSMRVFGVGIVEHQHVIRRSGARAGDIIVLLGPAGKFISSFLTATRDGTDALPTSDLAALRFPTPRQREMQLLGSRGLISAASDSSDGVLGAIENICCRSHCSAELDLDASQLPDCVLKESRASGVSPWNLFFFWGDWSIVITVRRSHIDELMKVARSEGYSVMEIGRMTDGPIPLSARLDGTHVRVRPLRNENFRERGFNDGILSHVEYMLRAPLFEDV